MSLDGICIRALVDDLKNQVLGGRVDKIHQPDHNTLIINLRMAKQNFRLLLSSHSQSARFHLTEKNRENPAQPPMFCMVMRKHLEGGRLTSIDQLGFERVVQFTFDTVSELGDKTKRVLIGEFMGKHSNLILVNPENNLILDSIKRLTHITNQYREVLPGVDYISPPPQNKISMEEINEEQLIESIQDLSSNKSISSALLSIISGFGPQTAKELSIRAGLAADTKIEFLGQHEYNRLWQSLNWLKDLLKDKNYAPTVVHDETKKVIAFAPFDLEQFSLSEKLTFDNTGSLLEYTVGEMADHNVFKQKVLDLEKVVSRELERCERKLALQLDKVAQVEVLEKSKIWGELITANLYQLKQGPWAQVSNFYSEAQEMIDIPLDPHLTPNENAQLYFKRYNKGKIASEKALEQMILISEETHYLESIKISLEKLDNLQDLQEVRWELEKAGYVKAKAVKGKKPKEQKSKPISILINDFTILVGKNNIQNDFVTFKVAKNSDLWFHAKDIPGSHVLVRNPEKKEVPKDVMELAASLAAYFSKGNYSSQVAVDYTLKKDVKKISGAKPGMVTYENQKTIFITPIEDEIKKLIKEETG